MKGKRMCSNEACDRYRVETSLLGGCECGAPLVPYAPPEPTDDQLERTMMAMGVPGMTAMMMTRNPQLRQGALDFHRLVCQAIAGDEVAADKLSDIRAYFGRLVA